MITFEEYKETEEYTPGTVISQSKPAGYTVDAGQTFKVVVATAIGTDTDPNLCDEFDEMGNCVG